MALRRRSRTVPRQDLPDSALRIHERNVARLIRELNVMLVKLVIENVEAFVDEPREDAASQLDALTFDGPDELRLDARSPNPVVKRIFSTWSKRVNSVGSKRKFKQAALAADRFNRRQVANQFKVVLAVDLARAEPFVAAATNAFTQQNAALITKMGRKQLGIVERIVREAQKKGTRNETLAATLEKRLSVTESRARLIARDQMNKLNGQLTKERHEAHGVRRYIWRTALDDRVRDEHVDREGKTYSYANPPFDGNPGEPIQCRCVAEPVIDDAAIDRLERSERAAA